MKVVVFGLSISSSWGNGHATLWRGILRSLAASGHRVTFFERNAPYYEAHRDLVSPPGYALRLYEDWASVEAEAAAQVAGADVAIVTSYCPDAVAATRLLERSRVGSRVFYDLDTPVTLESLARGSQVFYLPEEGLSSFDLVLSYTGGAALTELQRRLGARRVAPLYGSVDPEAHHPPTPPPARTSELSYLGTFAEDRQPALEALFLEPARRRPDLRFRIGGALYPETFPWRENIWFTRHVAPQDHPAFYGSSRMTLNVTRRAMAALGFCPSGRLFEAAACGTAVLSDTWEGLDAFFTPGEEILLARDADQAMAALSLPDAEVLRVATRARERVMDEHTAAHRARELVALIQSSDRATSATRAANDGIAAGASTPSEV